MLHIWLENHKIYISTEKEKTNRRQCKMLSSKKLKRDFATLVYLYETRREYTKLGLKILTRLNARKKSNLYEL
jgi:hypothetical protein